MSKNDLIIEVICFTKGILYNSFFTCMTIFIQLINLNKAQSMRKPPVE